MGHLQEDRLFIKDFYFQKIVAEKGLIIASQKDLHSDLLQLA